jgi:hypothetical protein
VVCVLRPGTPHAAHWAKAVAKRLMKRLKKEYPKAQILLRADVIFTVPRFYAFAKRDTSLTLSALSAKRESRPRLLISLGKN